MFPKWLNRALPVVWPLPLLSTSNGQRQVLRTLDSLDVTFRGVCRDCNNHWLSDLEREFRAVMQPAIESPRHVSVELSRESQTVVATWAVKTWLLAEFAHERRPGAGSIDGSEVLRVMRQQKAPPWNEHVSVGALEPGSDHVLSTTAIRVRDSTGELSGIVGILGVGMVVFVIHGVVEPTAGRPIQLVAVTSESLVQIWPNEVDVVSWPPRVVLGLDDLTRMFPSGSEIILP